LGFVGRRFFQNRRRVETSNALRIEGEDFLLFRNLGTVPDRKTVEGAARDFGGHTTDR